MDINSKNTINKKSYKILYTVVFITIIYLIYKFIYVNKNYNEPFDVLNINNEIIQELEQTKNEYEITKEKILNRIKEYDQAAYISNNFIKINPDSITNNSLNLQLNDLYPEIDLSKYIVINDQNEFNKLAQIASNFKNIYKPGEIVNLSSDFNIDKNKICYKESNLNLDPNFMKKYPECMVCSVDSSSDYKNMSNWNKTKTNIKEICLFNPNSEPNSGIPNLNDCKNFCKIN
jgi:hypothetical protein